MNRLFWQEILANWCIRLSVENKETINKRAGQEVKILSKKVIKNPYSKNPLDDEWDDDDDE